MTQSDRASELRATLEYVRFHLNDWRPVLSGADLRFTRRQLEDLDRCIREVLDADAGEDPSSPGQRVLYPGWMMHAASPDVYGGPRARTSRGR